jgi:hypothetical protein
MSTLHPPFFTKIFKFFQANLSVILFTKMKDKETPFQEAFEKQNFDNFIARMKLDIAVEAGKAYVGDLMLCVGAGTTWNQASNEVFGTNVKLTKDMLIIAPEDDRDQGVKTTIDPSGMKITDNRPGQNRIVEYDVNGVSVRRVISDGQVSSGKTSMIPIDQRNACMWIIRE